MIDRALYRRWIVPTGRADILVLRYALAWVAVRLCLLPVPSYFSANLSDELTGSPVALLTRLIVILAGFCFDGILLGCFAVAPYVAFDRREALHRVARYRYSILYSILIWIGWFAINVSVSPYFLFKVLDNLPSSLPFLVGGWVLHRSLPTATKSKAQDRRNNAFPAGI